MSKFDRGVFIFIGFGIWAVVMVYLFKPVNSFADVGGITYGKQPTLMSTHCPQYFTKNTFQSSGGTEIPLKFCQYQLVVTFDELRKHEEFFKN